MLVRLVVSESSTVSWLLEFSRCHQLHNNADGTTDDIVSGTQLGAFGMNRSSQNRLNGELSCVHSLKKVMFLHVEPKQASFPTQHISSTYSRYSVAILSCI